MTFGHEHDGLGHITEHGVGDVEVVELDHPLVDFLVDQVDGDFSYPKPSRSSFASATINDLPEGTYTIQQLDPDCTEWTVRLDWMTN